VSTTTTFVFGSAGQLGRDLVPILPGEVRAVTRNDADLSEGGAAHALLLRERPQLVVNCAAYNTVDKAESEPDAAFAVNAWAVRELALACRAIDARLVHISTDYVFGLDATHRAPWREADAPGPVSVYGMSKLTGEYAVRSIVPRHLVLRTCGLYGLHGVGGKGGNFVETMLKVAAAGKPLRVVNDQHCTPSYTRDVAAMIVKLIAIPHAEGVFHLTNAGATNWHDLAAEAFRLSGVSADLTPIPTSERNDPAKRPPFSVLSTKKLESFGIVPRLWRDALTAYLDARRIAKSAAT
jgi:dTDP-4-dehydrorhamnose reductase